VAASARKPTKEELYAEERLKNSPLAVNRRDSGYDLCQCGHTRKSHAAHCFYYNCTCDGFKPA
jgi:hypothetical protein